MHYGYEPIGIDHRDRNRQNNRPENLRAANDHQNAGNTANFAHNTSGVKGVSRHSRDRHLWVAQIKIHGKQTYIGRFKKQADAKAAYIKAAKKHFGEYHAA